MKGAYPGSIKSFVFSYPHDSMRIRSKEYGGGERQDYRYNNIDELLGANVYQSTNNSWLRTEDFAYDVGGNVTYLKGWTPTITTEDPVLTISSQMNKISSANVQKLSKLLGLV